MSNGVGDSRGETEPIEEVYEGFNFIHRKIIWVLGSVVVRKVIKRAIGNDEKSDWLGRTRSKLSRFVPGIGR